MNLIYHHDLSPFLLRVSIFGNEIGARWYGLAYVLGLAFAFVAFRWAGRRGIVRGLSDDACNALLSAIVAGVLLGGRLGYVIQHPHRLMSDPLFALQIWEGGMAFFGGLVGVILAMVWAAWRYRIEFWRLADVAAFPAALGLGLGRFANFVNGELWGVPTNGSWGVIFPGADALPRHPSQLYEAATHFLLFGILVWLAARRPQLWQRKAGVLAALFLLIYGALRFLTAFYRAHDTYFGPLSNGHWASLAVAVAGATLLWRRWILENSLRIDDPKANFSVSQNRYERA